VDGPFQQWRQGRSTWAGGAFRRPLLRQYGHAVSVDIAPIVEALRGLRLLIDKGALSEESWQAIWQELSGLFAEVGETGEELTHRERQVLQLAAEGLPHRMIGQRLMIERDTVETHLKKVRQKLDVPSTPAAVAAARRRGWIR